jgi:hypothetical protein
MKCLQVQLMVIGDKNVFEKVTKIRQTQTPIAGNWRSEKITSWKDFHILQEFLMKPCLSHPCG